MSDLYQIFSSCYLSPALVALRYVMYFRFVGGVMEAHNGQEYRRREKGVYSVTQQWAALN